MVKLWIWSDERYPEYGVTTSKTHADIFIELTEEEYREYLAVDKLWNEWQERLQKKSEEKGYRR